MYDESTSTSFTTKVSRSGEPLFTQLTEQVSKVYESQCNTASGTKLSGEFGDDCGVAGMVVPTPELQSQMANVVKWRDSTNAYLRENKPNERRFFPLGCRIKGIAHGPAGSKNARGVKDLIDGGDVDYASLVESLRAAKKKSSGKPNSFAEFIGDLPSVEQIKQAAEPSELEDDSLLEAKGGGATNGMW